MAKYRKKPVVIEAVQFTGGNKDEIAKFVGKSFMQWTNCPEVGIATIEGDMRAKPNDWIIKGIKGEFYPCKPDIFEQTYEKVDDEEQG